MGAGKTWHVPARWAGKILSSIIKYVALGRLFLYMGQVDFVFGQVKFEDHLPGGRQ